MNSTEHWQYLFEGGTTAFIVESDGTTVAALRVTENSTAHSRFAHNVRLMSAAPELLEALHHIMLCEFNSMSSRHEMVRLARKAIARATGDVGMTLSELIERLEKADPAAVVRSEVISSRPATHQSIWSEEMSGGHFNYEQYHGEHIANEIQRLIETNDDTSVDEYGYTRGRHYNEETIVRFHEAIKFLRLGALYAQRIDWLVSGDDGEESFHERLKIQLKRFE